MSEGKLSTWCLPQLRIVLLGGRNSGKSCLGNWILGKEKFVGREQNCCSRRVGVVSGRWLTVVDTPGWWCDFSSRDTSQLVKREIRSSVSLCPPGPHAVLIVVKVSSGFSERRRRAVEEHVALLGEGVWGHCVVVLTSEPGSAPAGEGGEGEGRTHLRWLVDKCGRRCHTVGPVGDARVAQLLEKIQELVEENGNRAFEAQHHVLRALEEEKRRVEEEAQQRFLRVKTHRSLVRENLRPVTDIRIVLLGAKGSGKTSTLNTILGRQGHPVLGRTAQSTAGQGLVLGRRLVLVDTPGWWMNYFAHESSRFDLDQLILSPSLCPPGPHVFLLTVRLDRTFTETYSRAAQEHVQLMGPWAVWDRLMVVFTCGDWLGRASVEQFIEGEGPPLKELVERCSNRYHVVDNRSGGDGFQVRELIWKMEEMLAGCAEGPHPGARGELMEQVEEKVRREEERARERRLRKERQRQTGGRQPLPHLRVVLVGGRNTGKSSCGNTILSRRSFCTSVRTSSCREDRAQVFGRSVAVLDTPACFSLTSDLLGPACVLLLVLNVSASFSAGQAEALEKRVEAAGARAWSRAAVLFSHGDWLGSASLEQRVESEGPALRRLLERCGDRYHVLDNKHWGRGAQVEELLELLEQMLAEEGPDVPHRGSAGGAGSLQEEGRKSSVEGPSLCWRSQSPLVSSPVAEAATSSRPGTSSDAGGQMVPLGAVGQAGLSSRDDRVLSGPRRRLRWTLNLPVCVSAEHLYLRTNGGTILDFLSPRMLLAGPPPQLRTSADHPSMDVCSLCQTLLRERTLQLLVQAEGPQVLVDHRDHRGPQALVNHWDHRGSQALVNHWDHRGPQALVDQWDHRGPQALVNHWDHRGPQVLVDTRDSSELQDLEAFIDLYFEMVWDQNTSSPEIPDLEEPSDVKTGDEEVLSSINRKLSKLEILEEIQEELKELRRNLKHSWKVIEDLRENKQDGINT